ncbi:MAG: hypothetical protein Q7T72_12200 [Bacteroidales bacterium]|nr:hypothetical protein [Bacteroidales bacterium]
MIKTKILLIIITALLIVVACDKDGNSNHVYDNSHFLVDKIYDYNNNLVGDYYYNEENKLMKIIFTDPINDRRIDYEFEYKNNKVENIKYVEYNQPQFNHNIIIKYNQLGQIIKQETYKNGTLVGHQNYKYYSDGKLKCLSDDNGNENYFITYNDSGNAIQVKWYYVDYWLNYGDTIEMYRNFKYDDYPKPNFGINYIFQIEPLPWFGTEALLEKNISANNMIEYLESGTKWKFTYNENNQPEMIETKWKDIETVDPMLLRIKYKEIK